MDSSLTGTVIDNIVKANKIYRFFCELENISDETRKDSLREILKQLQSAENDSNSDKLKKAREDREAICTRITESHFKKDWNRLTNEQKQEQLARFLKENTIDKKTKEKIADFSKKGKLTQKIVNYDSRRGKIISFIFEKDKEKNSKKIKDTSSDDD
jgi:hypothetical protein